MRHRVIRFLSAVCAVLTVLSLFGCIGSSGPSGGLKIVTTIFPAYDFTRQIVRDTATVTLLIPPGQSIHTYEPSAKDIITISECNLFIYNGGESDEWVDEVLASLDRPIPKLRMMDCVSTLYEDTLHIAEPEEGAAEKDEHVWTSPKNAVAIARGIRDAIISADHGTSYDYETQCAELVEKLTKLDADFTEFFETVPQEKKLMIFGDRFPLLYFTHDYGIEHYAAFAGCAEDTEPSPGVIAYLVDKAKEHGADTIWHVELSSTATAEMLCENIGDAEPALFHSCHSVTSEELENGETYESLMRKNLETLKQRMGG